MENHHFKTPQKAPTVNRIWTEKDINFDGIYKQTIGF